VAKKYYQTEPQESTYTEEQSETSTSPELSEESSDTDEFTNDTKSAPTAEVSPDINKPKAKELDNYKPDQKMRDLQKQLDSLDQKIDDTLGQLRKKDDKATEALLKDINKKPEGLLPGDDKLSEKEYQQ